ncbi:HNH endonuclease signature motif containing protein [Trujillonella humicola]|uniref:HNH endonuclease signature motif containing protein n=1 Tax=Trujillonella humicola TaxID=3383699 RepID=UPI003905D7CC
MTAVGTLGVPTTACPPTVGWASGPLGVVQAAAREIARQTAAQARAVAEFAASRPSSADRQPGERGAMSAARRAARPEVLAEVSEWAAQELVVALSISSRTAENLLIRSLTLAHRLPGTLAALESGLLHVGHLGPLLDHVAPVEDDEKRAAIESELLTWMDRPGRVTTPAQLGDKTRRVVLARDARAAARKLEKALRKRDVHLRPDGDVAGMATLSAYMTLPEAKAVLAVLGAYADSLPDVPGEPVRSRGQKMIDVLLDLVLRRGELDLPAVQVQLLVVAAVPSLLGGDQPVEIGGHVVPAEMARDLLRAVGLLPEPADATTSNAPTTAPTTAPGAPDPGAPDPGAPDPGAPDPGAPDPGAADPGAAPSLSATATGEPPPTRVLTPSEREEIDLLERCWALDARLPEDPAPVPDEVLRAWAEDADAELAAIRAVGLAPPPWFPDLYADLALPPPTDRPAAPVPPADHARPPAPADDGRGTGWWAEADRAVAAAGTALLDLDRALGHAGRLVTTAERADAVDEASCAASPAGRVSATTDALAALHAASVEHRTALAELLFRTAGGGLVDRPRVALVDGLAGTLIALTDTAELTRVATCGRAACRRRPARCTHDLTGRPGLTAPPGSAGYRPRTALDRFVRMRDRRCRFPGCRMPVPAGGELDHDRPHVEGGPTAASNLTGYCTPHHRGKHQAPGWSSALAADGTLTVTTPSGLTAVTEPPPF